MVHEDGSIRWVLEQAYPINDEHGNPWLIQGVIFDISARKAAEAQVAFLAYHDRLTGLPNRALLEEQLTRDLTRARRSGAPVALLYFDLDNFKLVNDSLGHTAGDEVLRETALRVSELTRTGDVLARQGGDEFLLLLDCGAAGARRSAPPTRAPSHRSRATASRPRWSARSRSPARSSTSARRSASRCSPSTPTTGVAVQARRRRDVPGRSGPAAGPSPSTSRARATRASACRSPRACAARSTTASCGLHYQPIVQVADGRLDGARGARALGGPGRGADPAGRVHPGRGGDRPDRRDRRRGSSSEVCDRAAAWAAAGLEPAVSFNVAAPAAPAGLRRHRPGQRDRAPRPAPEPRLGGDHRVGRAGDARRRPTARCDACRPACALAIDDFGADHSSLAACASCRSTSSRSTARSSPRSPPTAAERGRPARSSRWPSGIGMTPSPRASRPSRSTRVPRRRGLPLRAGLLPRPPGARRRDPRSGDARGWAHPSGFRLRIADPVGSDRDWGRRTIHGPYGRMLLSLAATSSGADRGVPRQSADRARRRGSGSGLNDGWNPTTGSQRHAESVRWSTSSARSAVRPIHRRTPPFYRVHVPVDPGVAANSTG